MFPTTRRVIVGQMLKFCARSNKLVNANPGAPVNVHTHARYIGRTWDNVGHGYAATDRVFECKASGETGRELVRLCKQTPKDPPLWPADAETARACGLTFQPIEFRGGEWSPAEPKKPNKDGAGK